MEVFYSLMPFSSEKKSHISLWLIGARKFLDSKIKSSSLDQWWGTCLDPEKKFLIGRWSGSEGQSFFSGMLWIRGIFSENLAVEIDKFEFFRQIRTLASLKAHKWYIRTEAKINFTFKNMIYVIIYSLVFFLRWYETSIDINVDYNTL